MAEDWAAVAKAVNERMAERGLTQMELAARSKVSLATVREIQNNVLARRRQPRTLTALSEALDWPPDHLGRILRGDRSTATRTVEADDPVLNELKNIHGQLRRISDRLDALERRSGDGAARP